MRASRDASPDACSRTNHIFCVRSYRASIRVHTHDFKMGNIILTTVRSVGSRACMHTRTREQPGLVRSAERRKIQVTARPPCSERNRIFFYSLRARGHLLACIRVPYEKVGNIWGHTKYRVSAAETASRVIVLFICWSSKLRDDSDDTRLSRFWITNCASIKQLRITRKRNTNTVLIYNDYMWAFEIFIRC